MLTVIPMIWLGYCGQPRRILDYPHSFGGWHAIASAGHLLSVAALYHSFLWYMIVLDKQSQQLEIPLVQVVWILELASTSLK
jgi:heme/copper-type cytochrome/quinol oxidase subunit 1